MSSPRLCLAHDPLFLQHVSPPGHPERPARLNAALQGFEAGRGAAATARLVARDATLEELSGVHGAEYLQTVVATAGSEGYLDPDTYFSHRTYDAARRASGAALAVTDALLSGHADYGFALMRPPGHHARPDQGMGFCLFNHVAVAARHALGRGSQRVVIVDWDVHHGNGTEEIFAATPEVMYISLHQSPQYPGTGAVGEAGRRDGTGYTVNVPLSAGADGAVYAAAFQRIVLPIIEQFDPDLTLVSAGYDAHRRDPLGGMLLDDDSYGSMTRGLVDTLGASARIGFLLEGGYDLQALTGSVKATVSALSEPLPQPQPTSSLSPRHEAELVEAQKAQRQFWKLD